MVRVPDGCSCLENCSKLHQFLPSVLLKLNDSLPSAVRGELECLYGNEARLCTAHLHVCDVISMFFHDVCLQNIIHGPNRVGGPQECHIMQNAGVSQVIGYVFGLFTGMLVALPHTHIFRASCDKYTHTHIQSFM